jgi:hypothetical protein
MGLPLTFTSEVSFYLSTSIGVSTDKVFQGGHSYVFTEPRAERTTGMTAMVQCISTRLPRNIIYDGFIAYSRSRTKKGAAACAVTPWIRWWAMKDF